GRGGKSFRQFAARAALQLRGQLRVCLGVGVAGPVPLVFTGTPGLARIPAVADRLRHLERAVLPAQRLAGGPDLVRAQRRAVGGLAAGLVGRAEADGGAAADQHRAVVAGDGGIDGGTDLVGVVAVDAADHLPAVRLEARRGVVGEPAGGVTVDR